MSIVFRIFIVKIQLNTTIDVTYNFLQNTEKFLRYASNTQKI